MKRARYFAGWLIDQHLAHDFLPSKTFVVMAHAIDAKEEREIYFPLITKKGRGVAHKAGGVPASSEGRNGNYACDTANYHVSAICTRLVFEYGDMTHRTSDVIVEDKTKLLPVPWTIGKVQMGCTEDVLTPTPKLT